MTLARTFRIWSRMAAMSLQVQLSYRMGSVGFLIGKLIRMFFFLAYLFAIFRRTDRLAGYGLAEITLFFMTFNLIDVTAQIFFRGIYGARRVVQEGDLDTYLTQPCSPLLRMACSSVDFLDVATLLPVFALLVRAQSMLPDLTPGRLFVYALLVLNGVVIALAIHIFVGALAVRTQELENTIWVYRDMMFLGKFPMDIYSRTLRWMLLTVFPIGVMISFPAKALLGKLPAAGVAYALALAAVLLSSSLWFWRDALRRYTSVSS